MEIVRPPPEPSSPPGSPGSVPAGRRLSSDARAQLAALVLTFACLSAIQVAVSRPMLLAERFLPGAGWVESALLSAWAAFLVGRLLEPRRVAVWRMRLWLGFSVVFFAQLVLGMAGVERLLMTGQLHVPVPAMIVAGPLYRGEGWFMPVLLAATLLLAGPAWCSYLCYIGAWDFWAARTRKRPARLPRWRGWVRVGLLAAVAAVAVLLRWAGVSGAVAAGAGIGFGLLGVGVMAALSRRTGAMVHCLAWCPIGVLATVGGRLSPFRMRIRSGCTDCDACATACRYDALRPEHVARRAPGPACTLCGDCLKTCRGHFIEYRFPGLRPQTARRLFFVVVASLHAVFLGVARI